MSKLQFGSYKLQLNTLDMCSISSKFPVFQPFP